MGKKFDFDYIVVGSGPAGSTAALELAKNSKKVCLVENRIFGGVGAHTYDLPSLATFDFSHTFSHVSEFPEFMGQDLTFNLATIPARGLRVVVDSNKTNQKLYEAVGITCVPGSANFLDNHTIAVGEKRFTADNYILATGAHLNTAGISGVENVKYLTPETAIKITRLPKVVAVIGGGSTGVELAEYYAELGVKVMLFEAKEHLVPREDPAVGDCLSNFFSDRLGITVLTSCKVVAIEENEVSKGVIFKFRNSEKIVRVDQIILATGSSPNLTFGLENTKVKFTDTGITVNRCFETSAKNIYAIGDCIGGDSSTDRAIGQANRLVSNILRHTKDPFNPRGIVRLVNTYPEVAVVGFTESELKNNKQKYQKSIASLSDIPAGMIHTFNYGFIKLLVDRTGHLLGASVVAPHASLIIGELALALRHNLTALELASVPHSKNNYDYLIRLAALELLQAKMPKKKPSSKKPAVKKPAK